MKIAQWCGTDKRTRTEWDNSGPGPCHFQVHDVPDYIHDLNAMHEAESQLSDSQLDDYRFHLMQITKGHPRWSIKMDIALAITADAAQRAEALLRAIGKWKE